MVNIWHDAVAPTSVGTSVTRTVLNGGVDYNAPQVAGALLRFTPEVIETGAMTAAESMMIRSVASSASIVNMVQKEFVQSYGNGGLSTFQFALAPLLREFVFNTTLPRAVTPITFSGEAQIVNTVAPEMGFEVTLTDGGPDGPEQFFLAPANETNTGTSAANAAGNSLTLNGYRMINWLSVVLTPGVVTASESYEGRAEFASANFIGVPSPQRIYAQSMATGLNTPISVATAGDRWTQCRIPIPTSCTVDTSLNLDEALTATANFICQLGLLKVG